jgi:DNA-binding transcriptional ArsR family regulator
MKTQPQQNQGNFCPTDLSLANRLPTSRLDVVQLRQTFKILANETRLRLLHALIRSAELCVNDLADAIGMKPQAVSNQLQRMVDCGIVGSRRSGNNIYYKIVDPCVPELLDRALCLIATSKRRSSSAIRQKRGKV